MLPVVFAPMALASVHPGTAGVLCGLAMLALLAQARLFSSRNGVPLPLFVLLLLIPAALSALQLIPLPRFLVSLLSPAVLDVYAAAADPLVSGGRTAWLPLALSPSDAALACVKALAVAMMGWAGFLATRQDDRSLRWPLRAAVAALVAVLAAVAFHAATDLDHVYLTWPSAGRGVSVVQGPFINSNHLSAFLLLMFPVAATMAWDEEHPLVQAGLAGLAVIAALIAVATLSRAALVGIPAGVLAVAWGERWYLSRFTVQQRLLGLAAVVVFTAIGMGAVDAITGGLVHVLLQPQILTAMDGRIAVWLTALQVLGDYPLVGTGAGAFLDLHFQYAGAPQAHSLRTAHCTYLQFLVDFGLLAGSVFVGGLLLRYVAVARRLAGGEKENRLDRGIFAGSMALAVQNIFGFSLLAPGVAVPAVVLGGAVLARHGGRVVVRLALPRLRVAVVGVLALSVLMAWIAGAEGRKPSDLELEAVLRERPVSDESLDAARLIAGRHPADPWGWHAIADALVLQQPAQSLPYVNAAMRLDPDGASPHWAAARAMRAGGMNSQALVEYRLALTKSGEHDPRGKAGQHFPRIVAEALAAFPDAAQHCQAAPREDPARRRFALELEARGADACAAQLLEQLQEVDPADVDVARARAWLLFRSGDRAASEAAARQLLAGPAPIDGNTILARLAVEPDVAEAHWREALRLAEGSARLRPLSELGQLLLVDERADDLRAVVRAQRARGGLTGEVRARCLYLEGRASALRGQREEARRLIERAIDFDLDVPAYHQALLDLKPAADGGGS